MTPDEVREAVRAELTAQEERKARADRLTHAIGIGLVIGALLLGGALDYLLGS